MNFSLPTAARSLLLRLPLYTPALLGLEGQEITALVLRVEDLQPFRQVRLPIRLRLAAWCSGQGTWVVTLAFRVVDDLTSPLEGDAYLNPRQAEDHRLLRHLTMQERLPFVFFRPDLKGTVGKTVSWPSQQRTEVQQLLISIDPTLTGSSLAGNFDPDFYRATQEFQSLYSIQELLDSAA